MSEAETTCSREQVSNRPLTERDRAALIEVRAAQLLTEAFANDPPANPWWSDKEVRLRDECVARAALEVDAGGDQYVPVPPVADDGGTDWTAEPREGLRLALEAKTEAEAARDAAGEVEQRALRAMHEAEAEVGKYGDLDARITRWTYEALKAGQNTDDLPYQFVSDLEARRLAEQRLERSRRGHSQLAGELRETEREVAKRQRVADAWATRICTEHIEAMCGDLAELRATEQTLVNALNAASYTRFPSEAGPIASKPLNEALNWPGPTREANWPAIEPLSRRWLSMHERLLSDPAALVE